MDLWVLIAGLAMLVVALPVAGRRVVFLYRLITSGQPAPDRVENVTKRLGEAVRSQVVEVFGQRKLLKWSVPGAAHFFVFWAFVILGSVYLEAFGILFSRNPRVGDPARRPLGPARASPRTSSPSCALLGHRDVRGHPAAQQPRRSWAAGPASAGPTSVGAWFIAVHDLQRHLDDVPLPRRGRPLPATSPTATAPSSRTPSAAARLSHDPPRCSRASGCCCTSA